MTDSGIDEGLRTQLRGNALFHGLSRAALEPLLNEIPVFHVQAGDVILTEGPAADEESGSHITPRRTRVSAC
jgi:hypothetical protein